MGYGDFMPGFNPAMMTGLNGMNAAPRAAMNQPQGAGMYSQPNMQPFSNAANVFLQQYGMQEPTQDQINPYLFFGNTGFMGNHPGIARAIDNGLSGLAFTQGSRTWGEGLSNVAQGILASRGAHIQNYVNQYTRPLQMAGELQGLQQGAANLEKTKAETTYYGDKAAATRPVIDPWSGVSYTFDAAAGKWVKEGPAPGQDTHGSVNRYTADQRKAASDYAADMRTKANAKGRSQAERVAYLREADDVDNGLPAWTDKKRANQIEIEAARLVGNAANAGRIGGNLGNQASGGVSEIDRLSFENDKSEANRNKLPQPSLDYGKRVMEDMTAQDLGYKDAQDMVDKKNAAVDEDLFTKHPQFRPGAKPQAAAPKSKPRAVAPKTGARPPLTNFEQK
jgi:hypothetical protein